MADAPISRPPTSRYELPLTYVLWLVLLAAAAFFLHTLKGALLPFFIAFVVAYVFAPWVDRAERLGLNRPIGTAVVFVLVIGLCAGLALGLLPVLHSQFTELIAKLPGAVDKLRGIPLLGVVMERVHELGLDQQIKTFVINFLADPAGMKEAAPAVASGVHNVGVTLGQATGGILRWVASSTLNAVFWVVGAAIVPVLVFYLMMDFHQVSGWLKARLPEGRGTGDKLTRIDAMLGEFLRGQLVVGLILSVLYAVGLSLAGVDGAITIGLVAGLGNMVPYLGFVLGIALAMLITLLSHPDLLHIGAVLLVFGTVQLLEGFFISPKVVGERVGLHPLAIIFALFVGAEAFGFLGLLLAVPAAIVLMVLALPEDSPA